MKAKLNLYPSKIDLKIVRNWLKEEKDSINGFFHDWASIETAFHKKQFATLYEENQILGFVAWSLGEIYASIDYFEIKNEYRHLGKGRILFNLISEFFKLKGFKAVMLYCSTKEAEKFWIKLGFIKFPYRGYSEPELTYFKPLIKVNSINKSKYLNYSDYNNIIELVNDYDFKEGNLNTKWTWIIDMKSDSLFLPILHPCNGNWNLKLFENGKIIRNRKVKYFCKQGNEIFSSPFLFIDKIYK